MQVKIRQQNRSVTWPSRDFYPGEMRMVHGDKGGKKIGFFEQTLSAKEGGPSRINGNQNMTVITAK